MSTATRQLGLFEPLFTGNVRTARSLAKPKQSPRPKATPDDRWWYTWQAPSEAEFSRLMAESSQGAAA